MTDSQDGVAPLDEAAAYTPDYSWYAGPDEGTYTIESAAQLAALSEIVNGTSDVFGQYSFKGQTVEIDSDIDGIDMNPGAALKVHTTTSGNTVATTVTADNATAFTPIGNADNAFEGTFDGNGKTISHLYVASDTGYLGLFGAVGGTETPGGDGYGTVENFNLNGVVCNTATSTMNNSLDYAGAVCGKLNAGGTIQNVVSSVDVEAPWVYNVGGIVGFAGTPTGDDNDAYGSNPSRDNTQVLCCGNEGVLVHGYNKVGGIVGEVAATVKYCYNKSWVLPRRSGRASGCGGIAGYNGNNNDPDEESVIAYCYNTGTITINGYPDGTDGSATYRYIGGIAGWGLGGDGKNEIYNCYNVGAIPAGNTYGSITAGAEGASEVAIRNNYSLDSATINNSTKNEWETGIEKTDAELKLTTYGNDDILTCLGPYFVADPNGGYPLLWWQVEGAAVPNITGLTVANPPKKTDYNGEVFDPTGMVVIATYDNGAKAQVLPVYAAYTDSAGKTTELTMDDGYTYDQDKVLKSDDKIVTIEYEGATAEVKINSEEPKDYIAVVTSAGDEYQLSYSEIDEALAIARERGLEDADGEEHMGKYVLVKDLLKNYVNIDNFEKITVNTTDCISVTVPGDGDYDSDDNLYLYYDGDCYRLAGERVPYYKWYENVSEIDVTLHDWGDTVWIWSDDYTSAEVERACLTCPAVETADASSVDNVVIAPGQRTAGKTTYTATATFPSDGTTVTDTQDADFTAATGSIDIAINKGGGDVQKGELKYSAINELMEESPEQTFTYTSHNIQNTLTKQYASISALLGVTEEICCYYALCEDDGFYAYLPADNAWMYFRDDTLIYRTAVNYSAGNKWVNSPTYIEARYQHDWGDLTWDWSDDYRKATVTGICQVDVCGIEEKADAVITSKTTEPGETVYTATATFSDGSVVTDTRIEEPPATVTYSDLPVYKNGKEVKVITGEEFARAQEEAPLQTFTHTSGGITIETTANFVLLTDLLGDDLPDEDCGFIATENEVFTATFKGEYLDRVYLYCYYNENNGEYTYRTAIDGTKGWAWTYNVGDFTLGHVYEDGVCMICGAQEPIDRIGFNDTMLATAEPIP